MMSVRFWLLCGSSLLLGACTTVPLTTPAATGPADAGSSASNTPSPYVLKSPRSGPPSLVMREPLSPLSVAQVSQLPSIEVTQLAAPVDLWDRMRRGFRMPDLDNDLVRDREAWYLERPDYLERMTERGSKYLFHIVEELERRDLPVELALLPFVESAYNPQAVSVAKAAGMWQFMPATGRDYDLKQNAFRDDRRDVLASTRAALDYLERLYRMFGDWHLALAAYNWGEGSVSRAIKKNEAKGLPTGYTDIGMPDETRYYVPKFQALKNIISRPQQLGTRLPDIGNHPFFDAVPIEKDMDVALIARLADITEKDLRQLNPAHTQPVILAAGTPNVLLPWDNAKRFEERLKAYQGPLSSWTAWRVRSDMSVAQAAKQLDLPESTLRQINRIPPRMRLKAGSTLLIPRDETHNSDVPEHIADNGQILLAPERVAQARRIKVAKGDTLSSLARRYQVSVADLRAWNRMSPKAQLKYGQTLKIQGAVASEEASASSSSRLVSASKQATRRRDASAARATPSSGRKKVASQSAQKNKPRASAKRPSNKKPPEKKLASASKIKP